MGNVIFVVIFVIFCAFLLGAGLISKRWVKESSDFVLAGREISTPINVVGVIAIGFAGTTVTLAPGFTIQYGLLGGLGWGVIYSVCGLLIFGLLYSNFVRRSGAQTLPEFLEMRYDGHTRSVVAITSVIGMCGIMANNVVSSVDNIAAFTGWNRLAITAIIFAVIIVFTFVSGLWATTITDLFQVLIGVIVVPATFFILAGRFGWLDAISANWGAGDFMSQGFVGALPGMKLTYPSVFNFIICFAVALVWGNNYYWMKVANCRSEKVARRSFVAAAIILIVVFMVPLCFIGGYMGAFYPEQLTLNGGTVAPTGTYGYVAKTLAMTTRPRPPRRPTPSTSLSRRPASAWASSPPSGSTRCSTPKRWSERAAERKKNVLWTSIRNPSSCTRNCGGRSKWWPAGTSRPGTTCPFCIPPAWPSPAGKLQRTMRSPLPSPAGAIWWR